MHNSKYTKKNAESYFCGTLESGSESVSCFSQVRPHAISKTVAQYAPPSMEFFRQEY